MPTIVNERAALRPTIYKSNGAAINLSRNAFEIGRLVAMLFGRNEQGFFYDPSDMGTMFQDAIGTTAVNTTGQPVGLILDKSKGLVLGPELFDDSKVVLQGGAVRLEKGRYRIQSEGPLVFFRPYTDPYSVNKRLRVEYEITEIVGGTIRADVTLGGSNGVPISTTIGKHVMYIYGVSLAFTRQTTPTDVSIRILSIKEVKGNHAYQTTSAARPILQQAPILGAEVIADGTFKDPSYWTLTGEGWSIANNVASAVNATGGVAKSGILKPNTTYEFVVKVNRVSGSFNLPYDGLGTHIQTKYVSGTFKRRFTTTLNPSQPFFAIYGTNFTGTVEFISAKEITGYHTDKNYTEYDGVDDKLITNLPAPLVNATVLRAIPNVGTEVKYNQTLPMLYEDSTNHAGLIAIDRALTRTEQLRLMTELDKKAGATSLETLTFKAFDNNQEGFVYDPNDLSTLFQVSTGVVPVTAIGQPVGLMLDKSKGFVLGSNQISYPNSEQLPAAVNMSDGTYTWTLNTVAPISGTQDSRLIVTSPSSISTRPSLAFACSSPLVPGKLYKFSFRYKVNSGAPRVTSVYKGDGTATVAPDKGALQGSGTFDVFIRWFAGDQTRPYVYFSNESLFDLQIDDISVREVKGNHAFQDNSASRPILRQNAVTGANYLEFDGSDDFLVVSGHKAFDESTLITATKLRKVANTQPVYAKAQGGYLYLVNNAANIQRSGDGFFVSNNPTGDVQSVVYKYNGTSNTHLVTLTTNNAEKVENSTGLGLKAAGEGFIGRFSSTGTAYAGIDLYGIMVIEKVMPRTEIDTFRQQYNKRMGI